MEIQAYFQNWSVQPGDTAELCLSTDLAQVKVDFVKLVRGPGAKGTSDAGALAYPGVVETSIAGRRQETAIGSYSRLPIPATDMSSAAVHCWVWPTLPGLDRRQTVWRAGDVSLVIEHGQFAALLQGRTYPVDMRIEPRHWYSVAVDPIAGVIDVRRLGGKRAAAGKAAIGAGAGPDGGLGEAGEVWLAASGIDAVGSPIEAFNGKIDSPTFHAGAIAEADLAAFHGGKASGTPILAWRMGADFSSDRVEPAMPGVAAGRIVNGAERGVTGRNWTGISDSCLVVPEEYAALQFHDDDMVESGWTSDLSFALPADIASGIYAVRLTGDKTVEHIPLFVRAARDARAPILFLVPTHTYLAYGNDHLAALDFSSVMTHERVLPIEEEYLATHRAPGRSCYDTHSDGTPVRYSSRRRPLLNVRPGYPNWLTDSYRHFSVDMYIVEWLEHSGIAFHVATDEDLDREGGALLSRYDCVVTGSHPEYWTRGALDEMDAYLNDGGRLMYLGGNGFYWVTSTFAQRPGLIEVRRDNSGTRCWDAPYGERTHVSTGEAGGIWRMRGRAPNRMLGVGFSSEGWSKGCGYRRLPDSYASPAAKFFAGIDDEIVGGEGFVLGGAVGDEVDRFDIALGSPEHAYVLGTSTGLGNEYQLVIEDLTLSLPHQGGEQRPDVVRSDIVTFPIDGGGAVFSVGSITYGGALAWNRCDNALSRMTLNVLKAFTTPGPVF